MRIFYCHSALDPVMIVLVLNYILNIIFLAIGHDLLEEISLVMALVLYLDQYIKVIRFADLSKLSKVNTNLEVNISFVKPYIDRISVSRAARYVSRDSISRMLNDLSSILEERFLR